MPPTKNPRVISVGYEQGDAFDLQCDVLALKYAQDFYGVDRAVSRALQAAGVDIEQLRPEVGRHVLVPSRGVVKARSVLLLGVPPLPSFGYANVEEFARRVLEVLLLEAPETTHVGMTLHGANFGLDVVECARRQVAGIQSALHESRFPRVLKAVTIVERDPDRIEVLQELLRGNRGHTFEVLRAPELHGRGRVTILAPQRNDVEVRGTFIYTSDPDAGQPASVFVAMPFDKKMRTVWKYGIQKPIHEAGLNCERMDEMHFTGDILDRMKALIQRAGLVIADITGNNPNVFLELGYAWGLGRATLLLVQRDEASGQQTQLPFDVRTQKCLFYEDAVDLEEQLRKALDGMNLTSRD